MHSQALKYYTIRVTEVRGYDVGVGLYHIYVQCHSTVKDMSCLLFPFKGIVVYLFYVDIVHPLLHINLVNPSHHPPIPINDLVSPAILMVQKCFSWSFLKGLGPKRNICLKAYDIK